MDPGLKAIQDQYSKKLKNLGGLNMQKGDGRDSNQFIPQPERHESSI